MTKPVHFLVSTGPAVYQDLSFWCREAEFSPVGSLARRGAGVLRGAGAERAVGAAQGAHTVHVQGVLAGFTLQAPLTPAHRNTVSKHTFTTHPGKTVQ